MSFQPINQPYQQQITREQLARTRQALDEMKLHYDNYEAHIRQMQHNIKTPEDSIKFSTHILELNRCRDNLIRHINAYNEMIQISNLQFSSRLSEQAKTEIYHFYKSGRYTQEQLAAQYGVTQSAISKIVNGSVPDQI
ncbi:TPA: helix-turn-helix domain-containing protein [Klebsiella michiganensis]|uniref:helix-turn-helix domain-containing protein n=1 Tax=Klebsiella michiganensis TaxID=1134687 RepID=UPI0031D06BD1